MRRHRAVRTYVQEIHLWLLLLRKPLHTITFDAPALGVKTKTLLGYIEAISHRGERKYKACKISPTRVGVRLLTRTTA